MSTVPGALTRLALACLAGALLLLGVTSSANAATLTDLKQAGPDDAVVLSEGVSITPGTVSQQGDTLQLTGATLKYGDVGEGTAVSGTATADKVTLESGTFTFADEVAKGTFTVDEDDPLTFGLGASTEATGTLVPAETTAPATGMRAFADGGIGTGDAQDAALGLLPKTPAANGPAFYEITLGTGNGSVVANLWQRVRQPDNSVKTTGRVLVNVTLTNRKYRVEVINWEFHWGPTSTKLNAVVAGNDILNPFEFTGVKGTLTGQAQIVPGLFLTGGELTWDKTGFHVGGSARLDCREGNVSVGLSGDIVNDRNWRWAVNGQTNGGCFVSEDLNLPSADLSGEIKSVDGDVTGGLEVGGKISTELLPAGIDQWDARFRFTYDGTQAGSHIAFYASAGIGTAQGIINFDGTLALNADFAIPLGASSVAFDGDIKRETPGGPVVYDVGGSANLAINTKASLGGSVRLSNTRMSVSGQVTLACPANGSITGAVSGDIPLAGGAKDWALGISGGAPDGCKVTKEFGLGAGTGLSGEVKSVAGVVSVAADANATINTTLIPTKSSFSAGFHFAASQGNYSVAVSGSTQGAGFKAAVASDSTYELSFNLDDLKLGNVTLGAKGSIKRAAPGAKETYSISGSLAGEAEIYPNLYIRSGSLSIDGEGGLKFSGSIRQKCTTGNLIANASGTIVDSRNWAFSAEGVTSPCTIGRAAAFDGKLFYADIESKDAKVLYNAGISASRINLFSTNVFLLGRVTTWLTNIRGSISNTCTGCLEGKKTRLTFGGAGNASFRLLLLPVSASVGVSGSVDIMGNSVRRVTLGIDRLGFTLFPISKQRALNQMEVDTGKGFTTA